MAAQHGRIGLATCLAAGMLCGIASTKTFAQAPASRRDAAILYVQPPGHSETNQAATPMDDAGWQRTILTQATLLNLSTSFTAVIHDPDNAILRTQWYAAFKQPSEATDWLEQHFHVTPIPGTALIEVRLDQQPGNDEGPTIVNAVVNQFLAAESKDETITLIDRKNTLEALRNRHETQVSQLKNQSSRAQGELQIDAQGHSAAIAIKEQQLTQLLSERVKTESALTEAKLAYDAAQGELTKGITLGAVEQTVRQNPEIAFWIQQVDALDVEILAAHQPTTSPQERSLTDRRNASQAKLNQLLAEQRASLTVTYMDQLASKQAAAQHSLDEINKQIDRLQGDVMDLCYQLASYVRTKDEMDALENLAREERSQVDELNMTIQSKAIGQVGLVKRAGG